MNRAAGDPKGDHPPQSFAIHFPSSLTPPFIFRFTWGAGQRGGGRRAGEGRGGERAGKARNAHLLWPTPKPPQPPPPAAAAAAAAKALPVALHGEAAPSECRLSLSPPPASPELTVAQTSRSRCRRPGSALPPRPADPFKPPGLAAAAPGGNAGRGGGPGGAAASGAATTAAAAGRPVR